VEREAKTILPWIGVLLLSCNAILGIEEGTPLDPSSDSDASSSSRSGADAAPASGGTGASSAAEGGLGGASAAGAAGGSGGGSGTAAGGSGGGSGGAAGGSGGTSGGADGAAGDGDAGGPGYSLCHWDCAGCAITSSPCCREVPCECGTTEVCGQYQGQACTAYGTIKKFGTKVPSICIDGFSCAVQECRCVCNGIEP
jgi:hypothetical protein